jgi:hypothetical protein
LLNPNKEVPKFLKYSSFSLRKKNCKQLGVGQDLTKFAKINLSESLKYFIIFFKKKIKLTHGYFGNFGQI